MRAGTIALVTAIWMLPGCGAWANHKAAKHIDESNTAYKECIAEQGDASRCTAQKQQLEADIEVYDELHSKRRRERVVKQPASPPPS